MMKFKKGYNLKIIAVILNIIFLCNATLYSCPVSKNTLRVPIGRYDRMLEVLIRTHDEHEQHIDKPLIDAVEEGLIPINAPMLGGLYRCPERRAPTYVEVGTFVEEDTTVCLIEVMKVFTAITSGVRGRIDKICAESGQLVEYGQVLFLVKPDESLEK